MEKRYRVTLTAAERGDLQKLVSVGKSAAQKLVRARILLLADQADGGPAKSDPEIVDALGCSRASVERIRKRRPAGRSVTLDAPFAQRPDGGAGTRGVVVARNCASGA